MKKVINIIISMLLCACLIINTSNFRRDTYAFVDPVTATIAVSFLVSLVLTSAGIYTRQFLNTEEGQQLCNDISNWITERHEDFKDLINSNVFVSTAVNGDPTVFVRQTAYSAITSYIIEYFRANQPHIFPDYVPSTVVNGAVTGSNIPDFFCNFIADFVYNNNPYHFNYTSSESDFLSRNSLLIKSSFSEMIDYKYINVYYHTSSVSSDSSVSSTYCNHLFVAHNGDPSDGYYALFSSVCFYDYSSSASVNYPSWSFVTPNNAAPFYSGTYGNGYTGVVSKGKYETKSLTVADYTQTAVYTNTDLVEDYVDSPPATVPDDIVSLDPADNAITNPDYITNVVNNYTTVVEGENVIPLHYPSYADTQNVIVDGLQDLTRTDVLDGSAKVGVQPVNETVSTVQGAVTVSNIADITHAVSSAINYGDGNLNVKDFKMDKDLTTVFPFCIPFDLIRVFNVLKADPVAPIFEFDFTTLPVFDEVPEQYHDNMVFKLDMRDYDDFVKVVRVFVFLSFVLFLIIKTRDLVRG